MRRAAILASLIAAQPLPALAQAAPATETVAPVDGARRAAAEAFAQSVDLRKQLAMANEIAAGQIESGLLRELVEGNPKAKAAREKDPARFEKSIASLQSFLAAEVRRMNAELEPSVYSETLDIYARTFTESELREIQAFYASSLGRKLLEKQPALMRECMAMAQRLMVQKMPTLAEHMKDYMQENDLDFASNSH